MENNKTTLTATRPIKQRFSKSFTNIALASSLIIGASWAHAAPDVDASDMTINGTQLSSLLNGNGEVAIDAGIKQKFRYTGYGQACSDVEWFIKLEGASVWNNFDHNKYAEQIIHRAGTHQLKVSVDGYNNWFAFCFHGGEYSEQIINLKVDTPSYAQTKYPIMVVPGVLAYDSINVIIDQIDYFYDVADTLQAESDQILHTFSLNPWQQTELRGNDLAAKIMQQVINSNIQAQVNPDKYPVAFDKVNLLAHSHGSTTARVAIKTLKESGHDMVASLTTVAGPHFGTPTADGALHGMENWPFWGPALENTLIPFFEFVGCTLATLAGDSHYCGQGDLMAVLLDFTQQGMYTFNANYPSFGLPTDGKYYLEGIPAADQVDNFYDAYGRGIYDSWYASTKKVYDVVQSDGSTESMEMVIGNGLGQEADINAPDAVQYYSFTGDAPSNSIPNASPLSDDTVFDKVLCLGSQLPTDILMDSILCVFNSFYGAMYWNEMDVPEESDFPAGSPEWIAHDGFIPVDSAKFGVYLGKHYWNHVDEQNQFLGIIPSLDPNGVPVARPTSVYRTHANRLQHAGL